MQKEVPQLHKLLDYKSFQIKGESPFTEKLLESNEPSEFLSHKPLISGELDSRKELHPTKLEQRPGILVKLCFRELCKNQKGRLSVHEIPLM